MKALYMFILFIISFIVWVVLIAFTNVLYYKDNENDRVKFYKSYARNLDYQFRYCLSKGDDRLTCLKDLERHINKNFDTGIISIESQKDNFKLHIDKDRYTENRKNIQVQYNLNNDKDLKVVITKATTPLLKSSTLRSMTFSICYYDQEVHCNFKEYKDAYQRKGVKASFEFFITTAFPRSMSALCYFICLLGMFFLSRKLLLLQFEKEQDLKNELERKIKLIRSNQTSIEKLKYELSENTSRMMDSNSKLK